MAQPNRTTNWFLDADIVSGRDTTSAKEPSRPIQKTREAAMPGVVVGGEPSEFSKQVGSLFGEARREAVARMHTQGITTYGWKDGGVVAVEPTKK